MGHQTFTIQQPFTLESGKVLPFVKLAYHSIGTLNRSKDNVVWVFHALTGNSNPEEWWQGLVGYGKLFNPEKYFIICVNMPGSHYGSTGPLDIDNRTQKPYYHSFPWFTTRDMIRAYQRLKNYFGITSIQIGLGGSMGGQQLLEWAIEEPTLFKTIIPMATNALHSSWGIAFNSSQRMAIENDNTWLQHSNNAGLQGMQVARSMALLSYRHYNTYKVTQIGYTEASVSNGVDEQIFKAESYQRYQGEKLSNRFNAFSYYFLTKAMDSHNVGRDRVSVQNALQLITAKTLVIGIDTDLLFPVEEQQFLADNIKGSQFIAISSLYGHDGFLVEFNKIENVIKAFL